MKTSTICKNCGGEHGIHHYQTNQCPVGGCEAPIGKKQEYKTSTFEPEDNSKEIIDTLRARIAEIEDTLRLGAYILTIPAVRDVMKSQLENQEVSPIADFEKSVSDVLSNRNGKRV